MEDHGVLCALALHGWVRMVCELLATRVYTSEINSIDLVQRSANEAAENDFVMTNNTINVVLVKG